MRLLLMFSRVCFVCWTLSQRSRYQVNKTSLFGKIRINFWVKHLTSVVFLNVYSQNISIYMTGVIGRIHFWSADSYVSLYAVVYMNIIWKISLWHFMSIHLNEMRQIVICVVRVLYYENHVNKQGSLENSLYVNHIELQCLNYLLMISLHT